jgi:hypothetical protein
MTQVVTLIAGLLLSAATLAFSIFIQRVFEWRYKKMA